MVATCRGHRVTYQTTMKETLSRSDAPYDSGVAKNADEIFRYLQLAIDGNGLNAIEVPSNVSASNYGIDRIVSNIENAQLRDRVGCWCGSIRLRFTCRIG